MWYLKLSASGYDKLVCSWPDWMPGTVEKVNEIKKKKKSYILEGTREQSRQLELVQPRTWREEKDIGGETNILHLCWHL